VPGDYLLMGDNRNNSNDNPTWGPPDGQRITGKSSLISWSQPQPAAARKLQVC
jgi:hypothetical protein